MYKPYYYIITVLAVITMFLGLFVAGGALLNDFDPGIIGGLSVGFGAFAFLFFVQAINKIITLLESRN